MPSTLNLLRSLRTLVEEEHSILASPEDYAFFRNLTYEKPAPAKTLPPEQPLVKLTPKFSPVPTPVPETPKPILPPPPPKKEEFLEIRKLFTAIAPKVPLLAEIPNDREARIFSEHWKIKKQVAPNLIIAQPSSPIERSFLENLRIALSNTFAETHILTVEEYNPHWNSFFSSGEIKFVLMSEPTLKKMPLLLPIASERFLGKASLLLIPSFSTYLSNPQAKRALWNTLCLQQ